MLATHGAERGLAVMAGGAATTSPKRTVSRPVVVSRAASVRSSSRTARLSASISLRRVRFSARLRPTRPARRPASAI